MKVSPQSAKLDRFLADQVYRFLAARLLLGGHVCVDTIEERCTIADRAAARRQLV